MGKSTPAGNTTTVQNSSPWSGQQPYLEQLFQNAQDAFNNGTLAPQAYSGNWVAPQSAMTQGAQGSLYNYGMSDLGANPGSDYYKQTSPYGLYGLNNASASIGMLNNTGEQMAAELPYGMSGLQNTQNAIGSLGSLAGSSAANPFMGGLAGQARSAGDNPFLGGLAGAANQSMANPFNLNLESIASNGGGSNPYLDQMFSQGANAVQSRLQSQFEGNGRSNSGGETASLADAYNQLGTSIYGGAYDANANRALSAAGTGAGSYNSGIGNEISAYGTGGNVFNTSQSNAINALSSGGGLYNAGQSNAINAMQGAGNLGLGQTNAANNAGSTMGSIYGQAGNLGLGQANIGNASAGGLSNNYNSGVQNRLSGYGAATGAGQNLDQYNQNLINAAMQQYAQNSGIPYEALARLAGLTSGNFGGTQSTSTPYFQPSTGQSILSGLGGLASIASLF